MADECQKLYCTIFYLVIAYVIHIAHLRGDGSMFEEASSSHMR